MIIDNNTVTIPPASTNARLTATMVDVLRYAIETTPIRWGSVGDKHVWLASTISPVTVNALVRRGFFASFGRGPAREFIIDVTDAGLEWAVENLAD